MIKPLTNFYFIFLQIYYKIYAEEQIILPKPAKVFPVENPKDFPIKTKKEIIT